MVPYSVSVPSNFLNYIFQSSDFWILKSSYLYLFLNLGFRWNNNLAKFTNLFFVQDISRYVVTILHLSEPLCCIFNSRCASWQVDISSLVSIGISPYELNILRTWFWGNFVLFLSKWRGCLNLGNYLLWNFLPISTERRGHWLIVHFDYRSLCNELLVSGFQYYFLKKFVYWMILWQSCVNGWGLFGTLLLIFGLCNFLHLGRRCRL